MNAWIKQIDPRYSRVVTSPPPWPRTERYRAQVVVENTSGTHISFVCPHEHVSESEAAVCTSECVAAGEWPNDRREPWCRTS